VKAAYETPASTIANDAAGTREGGVTLVGPVEVCEARTTKGRGLEFIL
jgi:hypothetical protein